MIGIIGNTHGVKMDARPNPKASARKPGHPSADAASAGLAARGFTSENPEGMAGAAAAAEGLIVSANWPVQCAGSHSEALQVS